MKTYNKAFTVVFALTGIVCLVGVAAGAVWQLWMFGICAAMVLRGVVERKKLKS